MSEVTGTITKLLYLMAPPDGGVDVKVGITTLSKAEVRLGTYQNALGPRFLCKWPRCWVGPGPEIERLERALKRHYKSHILYEGRGYTEWVCDLTWQDVWPVVDDTIAGHRFKVEAVPDQHLPLSQNNLDAYRDCVIDQSSNSP